MSQIALPCELSTSKYYGCQAAHKLLAYDHDLKLECTSQLLCATDFGRNSVDSVDMAVMQHEFQWFRNRWIGQYTGTEPDHLQICSNGICSSGTSSPDHRCSREIIMGFHVNFPWKTIRWRKKLPLTIPTIPIAHIEWCLNICTAGSQTFLNPNRTSRV